ncbi:hypothetical protein [Streptomyces zagrosensis]|uniref:Uncharacterized protein n=1 Tax=Streptomyces zagrosensis TaxID=1042984 RepID=A0A7W9V2X9_9ACTN|nr:hypothetical protein [Streptomyces zagrosensis]MBB5939766.1 hypothetical protein [Streptomyces zagrosensis]
MFVEKMHEAGVRSEHAPFGALVSTGGALVSTGGVFAQCWTSQRTERAGTNRADRSDIVLGKGRSPAAQPDWRSPRRSRATVV